MQHVDYPQAADVVCVVCCDTNLDQKPLQNALRCMEVYFP
jgi:hypothetical protein